MTVGQRLKSEINAWGGGIRPFLAKLKESCEKRGIRGYGAPALYRRIEGETEPSYQWLDAAGGVLGVRVEWLATGKGRRTKAEEIVAALEKGTIKGHRPVVTTNKFQEATVPIRRAGSGAVDAALHELVRRLIAACPSTGNDAPHMDDMVRVAEGVQRLLLLPLEALDPTFRSSERMAREAEERYGLDDALTEKERAVKERTARRWGAEERHADYLLAALHALMLAVPPRRLGLRLQQLVESLESLNGAPESRDLEV